MTVSSAANRLLGHREVAALNAKGLAGG